MEISKIVYFNEPGPSNTGKLLRFCKERLETLKIRHVVMASNTGSTLKQFLKIYENAKTHFIVVSNSTGSKMPVSFLYAKYPNSKRIKEDYNKQGIKNFPISISKETAAEFEKKGIKVCYIDDVFGISGTLGPWGKRRSLKTKLDAFLPRHLRPLDIEAGADLSLLNIISMGFRVCIGITAVSVKNRFVPKGEMVLSIAGTGFAGGGADTAVILQASANPKKCYVKEIIGFPKFK
jgi:hypothetical protein